jgi:hypothetical protein
LETTTTIDQRRLPAPGVIARRAKKFARRFAGSRSADLRDVEQQTDYRAAAHQVLSNIIVNPISGGSARQALPGCRQTHIVSRVESRSTWSAR